MSRTVTMSVVLIQRRQLRVVFGVSFQSLVPGIDKRRERGLRGFRAYL